jgi:hypothetical protein
MGPTVNTAWTGFGLAASRNSLREFGHAKNVGRHGIHAASLVGADSHALRAVR